MTTPYKITAPDGTEFVRKTTTTLLEDWLEQVQAAIDGKRGELWSAIRKHGGENMQVAPFVAPKKTKAVREGRRWIVPPMLGKKHSAATKRRMSAAQKGRPGRKQSAESKAKIAAALKGRVVSAETRAKISSANTGRRYCLGVKHTAESRANMAEAARRRWQRHREGK